MSDTNKPKLKLVGKDGNAYALMGLASKAARKAGWSKERIDALFTEATSGDYGHLLATLCNHFEVS